MWIDTPVLPVVDVTSRPIPRILKLLAPKLVGVKLTFGAFICRSETVMICYSRSMSPVSAVTAIGTS